MEGITNTTDFIVNLPLYTTVEFLYQDQEIVFPSGTADLPCPSCGKHTPHTFVGSIAHPSAHDTRKQYPVTAGYVITDVLIYRCTRINTHVVHVSIRAENKKLTKIGQHPSMADLHMQDLKRFTKLLGDKQSELVKGVRLASSGVGIGSFVYLRRIFEHLINQTNISHPIEGFEAMRMDDKILALRDHLPETMVKNRKIYSILSKGIHELSEGECLTYFNVINKGIQWILDEQLEVLRKRQQEIDLANDLGRIAAELSEDH